MKLAIVTDSATGFSLEEMKKYNEIYVVPLTIIDEKNNVYEDDNIDINNQQLYDKMITDSKHLKTSQTNREKMSQCWRKILQTNDQILFLPIGQDASGQYESGKVLQEESEFKDKVYVYETGAAMVPLKAMSIIAWKLVKQGKNLQEVIVELDEFRKGYECYLAASNLSYLLRGGRIPNSLAQLANILKLKPILKCKEKIIKQKVKRTINHAMKEMLDLIVEKFKNPVETTLYVINGWCDNNLLQRAISMAKEYGFKKIVIEPLCNILQTHTGDNTIGFSVVENSYFKEI